MSVLWMFLLTALWLVALKDVKSKQVPPGFGSMITYDDIEALNASCNTLDNCKYDRVVDSLDLYNCNCGRFCAETNTCCVDSKHRLKTPQSQQLQIECNEIYGGSYSVFMVDRCNVNWTKDPSVEKLCKSNGEELDDPFLAIPVTNKISGVTYKNYFCSVCNDDSEEQPVFWNLKLSSRSKEVLSSEVPKLHYNITLDSWVIVNGTQNGRHSIVSFSATVPENLANLVHSCHPEVISKCAWSWTDLSTARRCDAYMAIVRLKTDDGLVMYRNPHCAVCNFEEFDSLLCNGGEIKLNRAPSISSNTFFVGLFSLHDKTNACEENMVYDSLANKCRKVYKG